MSKHIVCEREFYLIRTMVILLIQVATTLASPSTGHYSMNKCVFRALMPKRHNSSICICFLLRLINKMMSSVQQLAAVNMSDFAIKLNAKWTQMK